MRFIESAEEEIRKKNPQLATGGMNQGASTIHLIWGKITFQELLAVFVSSFTNTSDRGALLHEIVANVAKSHPNFSGNY
ncbi:hypothetical protein HJG54_12480 [Leptolyngbya sp. NK1-12]|uniref:Uncharacterized protein n=1 Tax=Leptolyngbya sp. NK1-12 TaxID=2547451 RepID=A0AA96WC31_9CYAN|nr:hypothetical protein [Leptolyngbya sp. NK1-12]WNZ23587.1 hypothetical protein HJG54_12480 [Leptolyngbya sp. NK1-12]